MCRGLNQVKKRIKSIFGNQTKMFVFCEFLKNHFLLYWLMPVHFSGLYFHLKEPVSLSVSLHFYLFLFLRNFQVYLPFLFILHDLSVDDCILKWIYLCLLIFSYFVFFLSCNYFFRRYTCGQLSSSILTTTKTTTIDCV